MSRASSNSSLSKSFSSMSGDSSSLKIPQEFPLPSSVEGVQSDTAAVSVDEGGSKGDAPRNRMKVLKPESEEARDHFYEGKLSGDSSRNMLKELESRRVELEKIKDEMQKKLSDKEKEVEDSTNKLRDKMKLLRKLKEKNNGVGSDDVAEQIKNLMIEIEIIRDKIFKKEAILVRLRDEITEKDKIIRIIIDKGNNIEKKYTIIENAKPSSAVRKWTRTVSTQEVPNSCAVRATHNGCGLTGARGYQVTGTVNTHGVLNSCMGTTGIVCNGGRPMKASTDGAMVASGPSEFFQEMGIKAGKIGREVVSEVKYYFQYVFNIFNIS
ncbi:hypothetical protein [Pasteuria penetrans]|uniref:hypothetical protein n=1 Tax=Pasteuria penetrans TaxID=86005 RepID=UPI0011ED340B|nr:hypothetical protein [Pasteuria penetrans]